MLGVRPPRRVDVIRLSPVRLGVEEEQLALEVLRSGQLAQGPMVARLEQAFVELTGTRHAIATSSGTTALVLALEVLDLRPGDEVLTSPFTFAATLNAILEAGAIARFADVGDDFLIDAEAVGEALTRRTRVLMPVHLYGCPSEMRALEEIVRPLGVTIVEDAAQALGATVAGRTVGSYGLGCFSLYATKNVTSGEGGIVTTDDDEAADRMRLLRNQGSRRRYEYEVPGHNYRLTDLQACIALPQLERLAEMTARRRANAARLDAGLQRLAGIAVPVRPANAEHVYHQYTIRVRGGARLPRDAFAKALAEGGVETGIYYPRVVFDYPCYSDHPQVCRSPVPNAHRAASEVLSLPVHPWLTESDLDQIIELVRTLSGD